MISTSDSAGPTCPRPAERTAPSTSRRRYRLRSSSLQVRAASAWGEIWITFTYRLMESAGLVELAGKTGLQVVTPRSENAPGPAFRQIVIEDDQTPDHPENRIQSVTAHSESRVVGFELPRKPLDQQAPAAFGEIAARVDRGVGHKLDRIVPAEILEINETQLAILATQRIMQSEVRWTQSTMGRREWSSRIPPETRIAQLKAPNRCGAGRNQTAFDEAAQARMFTVHLPQPVQPAPILRHRFQRGKDAGGRIAQA